MVSTTYVILTLENFKSKGGEFTATIEEMLKLFGKNERIDIIDNKDLDTHLQIIAQSMSSSLRATNESIKEEVFLNYPLYGTHLFHKKYLLFTHPAFLLHVYIV